MPRIKATVRRVWNPQPGSVHYVVIIEPIGQLERVLLRTPDSWLASLADRYADPTRQPPRPAVWVTYEPISRQLLGVDLIA